ADAQHPLHAQSTGPMLLVDDIPHGLKPQTQRQTGVPKERAGRNGEIMAASGAAVVRCFHSPNFRLRATRAARAIRPAELLQIHPAGFVIGEPGPELTNGFGIVRHAHTLPDGVGGTMLIAQKGNSDNASSPALIRDSVPDMT